MTVIYPTITPSTISSSDLTGTGIAPSQINQTTLQSGITCTIPGTYVYPVYGYPPVFYEQKIDLTTISSEDLMEEVLRRGMHTTIKEYRAKKGL